MMFCEKSLIVFLLTHPNGIYAVFTQSSLLGYAFVVWRQLRAGTMVLTPARMPRGLV